MGAKSVSIPARDLRAAVRAIGKLQGQLESAIDSILVPGTVRAMPGDARTLAGLRREWRWAEELIKRLEAARSGR